MAIGVRILSNNLSGKTGDVTFYPITGGTINIGMETIPFNYINPYPYGLYEIYFSEYDYTYPLFVADPTPLELILETEYTPGSLIATYTLTSNVWLSEELNVSFTNTLGTFSGPPINIITGITMPIGSKSGQTIVTLNEDFNNYNGDSSFSSFSGLPSGATITTQDLTPNKQSAAFWVTLTGGTNLGSITFAYGPLTAQTINFGLDGSSYYKYDFYPLTNRGYTYYAVKNDYSEVVTIFTDSYGNELSRVTLPNNNTEWSALDGFYNYISDGNNGVYYYSDGFSSYTFTWDVVNYPYHEIDWDYYAVTSNNSFIIRVWNDSNENKFYLINKNTSTLIDTYDGNLVHKWHDIYLYSNFIIRTTQNTNGDNNLLTVEILELDGVTVRRTIDLSGGHYTAWNYAYWSTNKFSWVLWDWSNTSSPYKIMNYDGLSDTLDSLDFGSYDNYSNIVWRYDDKFWTNDSSADSLFIVLNSNSGGTWYGWGMNRCQIFYMLSGQTTFSQYNFTDTGTPDKYLYPYGNSGNNFFTYCSTGGTDFSVLSITQSGTQITQVAVIGEGTAVGQDQVFFGDKYIQLVWKNSNYDQLQLNLFNENAQITDVLNLTLSGSFQRNDAQMGGVYYITDYTSGWWANQTTDTFQVTNSYYPLWVDSYFSSDGLRPGIMGLRRDSGPSTYFRLLFRESNISNEWQVATNNTNYTFRIGRTNILYVYNDEGGFFNWILYDFSGNTVQTVTTNVLGANWSTWAVKDRYVVRLDDGVNYTYYGISSTGYLTQTSNRNEWSMINDYIWWD